mgnify:FL=1
MQLGIWITSHSLLLSREMTPHKQASPPCTEITMFDASILGQILFPEFISSLIEVSKSSIPPTVRIVVTPLINCVFANPATSFLPKLLINAFDVISLTSLTGSDCFFFSFPEPARWTCRLISPWRIYFPSRFASSRPDKTFEKLAFCNL